MTCIAFDGRYVATDKMACSGTRLATGIKMVVADRKVLAWCGDYSHGVAMMQWYTAGCTPAELPPSTEDRWASLYVFERGETIRCFEAKTHPIILLDEIMGAGTGGLCALGAMSAGKSAEEAVKIATRWCDGVGNGVHVIDLWEVADVHDRGDRGSEAAAPCRPAPSRPGHT